MEKTLQQQITSIRQWREKLLDDPYRPGFHFVVPEGVCMPADPNGAIFWNGRYHLGYIYQDEAGRHCWGHVSSLDLLHWRHHRPWLIPTDDSPETGIFSGNCFVNKEGQATMHYHGFGSGNAIATSSDSQLDTWQKLPGNPIVPVVEEEYGPGLTGKRPFNAWDPHGWLEGDTYYAIFGGQRPAVFKAKTLDDWKYVGDLFAHPVEGVDIHEDVSCPDFFRMGDKWVLVCISHKLGCRYYVGEWRNEQFYPEYHAQMSWLDNGFFAPESLLDGNGRRIMWAWLFSQIPVEMEEDRGWSGTFSLPRELWLENNRIKMRPIEELNKLRYNERQYETMILPGDEEKRLPNLSGSLLDIDLVLEPLGAEQCGVKVFCGPDGEEETIIGYNAADQTLFVDTSRSSSTGLGVQGVEAGPFSLRQDEKLRLRIFLDRSVIEVFANDRQAIARRIYPSSESVQIKLFSTVGAARVRSLRAWDMMPTNAY
jgi:beta-fructofuranosidase